jgi:hypothetical protein
MARPRSIAAAFTGASLIAVCSLVIGQDWPKPSFTDTPMLPGGKWHVHDSDRPLPPVIDPGTSSNQELPGRPPSDAAEVLFDGKHLARWRGRSGGPPAW